MDGRRMVRCLGLAFALACAAANATEPAQAPEFDSGGYRTARFRAPVTLLPGAAARISLADALKLKPARDALFIDVLPVASGVRDPATGIWRIHGEHETIPGALWHPEVGRSPPDPVLWQGLRRDIAAARADRGELPVVVFCRIDCWMSWNAARRLAGEGVPHVFWLAEGIEGWHEAQRPLAPVQPVAVPGA